MKGPHTHGWCDEPCASCDLARAQARAHVLAITMLSVVGITVVLVAIEVGVRLWRNW